MTLVRAAGGLLWRRDPDGPRVAIVHRPKRGDWSLPKGRLDDGERWEEAALREVEEETGCRARLLGFAGATSRLTGRLPKVILYWHMALVREGRLEDVDEIDEVCWLPKPEALRRLEAGSDRRLLTRSPPGGVARSGRGAGHTDVAAVRTELLRRGLRLPPDARALTIGPALELLDEADEVAVRGEVPELRVLLLAARWLVLASSVEPGRERKVAELRAEARRVARPRRRVARDADLVAAPGMEGPASPEEPHRTDDPPRSVPSPQEPIASPAQENEAREEFVPNTPPDDADDVGVGDDLEWLGEDDLDEDEPDRRRASVPALRHELRRAGRRAAWAVGALAIAGLALAVWLPRQRAELVAFAVAGLAGGAWVAAAALGSARRRHRPRA